MTGGIFTVKAMQSSDRAKATFVILAATVFGIGGSEILKDVFSLLSVNYDHDDGNSLLNYLVLPISFLIAFGLYRLYQAWGEDIYKIGFLLFVLLHIDVLVTVFAAYKNFPFIVYLLVGIALDMAYSLTFLMVVTRSMGRKND